MEKRVFYSFYWYQYQYFFFMTRMREVVKKKAKPKRVSAGLN
jgi:hypothetical protein